MHPVDDVVASIERADAIGTDGDLKRVSVPCGLERLVPPPGTVQKRGADRLGGPRIEIVDDRFYRITHPSRGIPLLEAVAANEPLGHRCTQWCCIVLESHRPESGPGVEGARLVPIVRQRYKGMVQTNARSLA